MSAHFSKFMLNTYGGTAYFQAFMPEDYPLSLVLQKCRRFRKLPEVLRELSAKAKAWACRVNPSYIESIEEWYDDEGYELDPDTGKRLTDEQVEEQWRGESVPDGFKVVDIDKPPGGFPDPDTWEKPSAEAEKVDRSGLTEKQLESDIASRGIEATARTYGVPSSVAKKLKNEKDCVRAS